MASSDDLLSALSAVWRIPSPGPDKLLSDPRFLALSAALERRGSPGQSVFALSNGLRSLGLPSALAPPQWEATVDLAEIAAVLERGFCTTRTRRRHLCPLELADTLPPVSFGPARVGSFTAAELEALFDRRRLERHYPSRALDFGRLAQLQWLIVEETVDIDPRPEARAVPILFQHMDQDFGAFDAHEHRYPTVVERALFCLLLLPWENWSTMLEVDWRGFRLPWIYSVDKDLAMRPAPPPDLSDLAFEPVSYTDAWGDRFEDEKPSVLPLEDGRADHFASMAETAWGKLEASRSSELFSTPVEHFMVRAYAGDGIDELLAHMTVIEAAVGDEADHNRQLRPKPERALGATERMARKVAGLLRRPSAGDDYRVLFDIRSRFVHGRAGIGSISTTQRVMARRLAREVAAALLDEAASRALARADLLAALLARGSP